MYHFDQKKHNKNKMADIIKTITYIYIYVMGRRVVLYKDISILEEKWMKNGVREI